MIIFTLISCTAFDATLCDISKKRFESIQHQHTVLKALKDEDRLGNRKANVIITQLTKEKEIEKTRMNRRCEK